VETDISMFLEACPARSSRSRIQGQIQHVFRPALGFEKAGTGLPRGNISVSPLSFVREVAAGTSWCWSSPAGSWATSRPATGARGALLKPRAAVLTTILPDHLDRYGTMEAYVADNG
jgi:UDP-N-acetylmuramoylalanine--D-glutamate ligase